MLSKERYFGLGQVPVGIGAILRGWNILEDTFIDPARLPVVDFRAMSPACPHNCFHCFTDKARRTLTFDEIKRVIDEIADMGAKAIDYLGEGEPTVDPLFFPIIEYTSSRGVIPVIFTDAATKMRDRDFVSRVYDSGASVCPKCDSLFNAEYQNWVVGDKTGTYFDQRNDALEILINAGFNDTLSDGSTRLGFDMVVSSKCISEVPDTLRFCRERNLWVIFAFYLPTGRSGKESFDKELEPTYEAKQKMRQEVERIDQRYHFNHQIWNNFATMPCVERIQIYGDGRVSPCPGNETVIGMVQESSIQELHRKILEQYPGHHPTCFDGHCLYRPTINC